MSGEHSAIGRCTVRDAAGVGRWSSHLKVIVITESNLRIPTFTLGMIPHINVDISHT